MDLRRTLIWLAAASTVFVPAMHAQTTSSPATRPFDETCALAEPAPALPLSTSGRYIVDSAGKRFKIHAAAWYGGEGTDFAPAGLNLEPLDAIARRIRCMGFNTVRLPWSNEMYESNPVVPDYALTANPQLKGMHALALYSAVVQALAAQGVLVILDDHNSNAEWCCGDDGNDLWYNSQYPESSWIADWQGMTKRFKDLPQVIGADLRNEPRIDATWGGDPTTDWHGAAERGGNAVLGVNPKLLIFVEGVSYALDLTGVQDLPVQISEQNKLVYSAHDYPFDHNGVASAAALETALNQQWGYILTAGQPYTAPVWLGEFGNCHNASTCITDTSSSTGTGGFWFAAMRQYLAKYDIDWSWWAVNGTESSGSGRIFGGEESYGVLNPFWNSPAMPDEINPLPTLNVLGALQTVAQPNQGPGLAASYPPLVAMTQPLPGSTMVSGASIVLSANANLRAGSTGSISAVNFYANRKKIGSVASAPYTFTWSNVPPGSYDLYAEAVTASGATVRSESTPVEALNYVANQRMYSDAIGINFASYAVTPMAASEMAGAVAQSNWNQAGIANSGELQNLVDKNGTATTGIVSWTAPNTYFTAITDEPGNNRMMKGYLDNNNTQPNTVAVSGLPKSFRNYDVIVYFDGGNEANGSTPGATRVSNFRLTSVDANGVHGCADEMREGSTITGTDLGGVDFAGTFLQASGGSAGNYVEFLNCTGSSFNIAPIHGGTTDNQVRAPINGLQILGH